MAFVYTIGVKRRFLPGFKRYVVTGHENESVGTDVRLVLYFADGGILAVPGLARRAVKVYPDYKQAMDRHERERAEQQAKVDAEIKKRREIEEEAEREFERRLAAQRQLQQG